MQINSFFESKTNDIMGDGCACHGGLVNNKMIATAASTNGDCDHCLEHSTRLGMLHGHLYMKGQHENNLGPVKAR